VTNQHDARQKFGGDHFDYVLLDLQIPAKPGRGGASKAFGMNLLRELVGKPRRRDLPVIIMTAYTADGLNLASKLTSWGPPSSSPNRLKTASGRWPGDLQVPAFPARRTAGSAAEPQGPSAGTLERSVAAS